MRLTDNQKDIFEIISIFIKNNGYPPTLREILVRSKLKSLRGIVLQLESLRKLGVIDRHSNARGINLNKNYKIKKNIKVPLISSSISAGLMSWVNVNEIGNFDRFLELNPLSCKGYKNIFAVKVRGDSMIDANIFEDDFLLFIPQNHAVDGDIVLAQHDEEMTVKKLRIVENRPMLFPANKKYMPILKKFSVQGIVVNVIKSRDANLTSKSCSPKNI